MTRRDPPTPYTSYYTYTYYTNYTYYILYILYIQLFSHPPTPLPNIYTNPLYFILYILYYTNIHTILHIIYTFFILYIHIPLLCTPLGETNAYTARVGLPNPKSISNTAPHIVLLQV